MKILYLNDYGTPKGGAEQVVRTLSEGMRRRGHEVQVLAARLPDAAGESFAHYECYGTNTRLRTVLQVANPSAWVQVRRALADFRPTVVHVNMFLWQLSPAILPLLRSVPSLYNAVTYKPVCPVGTKMLPDHTQCRVPAGRVCYDQGCLSALGWLPSMMQMKLWRRWRGVFKVITACSECLKRQLVAEGIEPVEVILGGTAVRPARPALTTPPLAVFAGRLERAKGADVLLRAFARVLPQVPTARLLLAGEGSESGRLQQLAADLAISESVTFSGLLPWADLERRLSGAWVQVVPSRWAEPFGMVAVEAMMRGTAVVASATGGLLEIVDEGVNGLLVPPENEAALAEALSRLLGCREQAETLGRAGRRAALARFTEDGFVEQFERQYQRICV